MNILLIDDNESITEMMSKYLTGKGHKCTVVNDGRNGLTLIEQKKFDVVLLDLAMPEFTGIDVIDHLYKSGKINEQKIILFTASSVTDEEIQKLIKKGAQSCLKKPVKLEVLLKTIGAWVKIISDENSNSKNVKPFESDKIKELEQERIFLKDFNDSISAKVDGLEKSKQDLENKLGEESIKFKELKQEKILLDDLVHDSEKNERRNNKKYYVTIAIISVAVSVGFVGYSYYENQAMIKATPRDMSNYNSNYVIQNLQGDTVNTWVAWNIANGRIIHVHVVNNANLPQNLINAMEDAILSVKGVEIDDSLTGKGPKGTSSVYYVGWEGAVADAYSQPTKSYIPQNFDINGSPDGVGDIEIILTNDVNPDGYSGFTKSLSDGSEILKSKITIYKANKLDADRLEAIMRHEFGHALGLAHSTASEDLMHPMLPDYPYISSCDVNALHGLYDGDKNSKVVCKKWPVLFILVLGCMHNVKSK